MEDELADFLLRHVENLRAFSLEDFDLAGGTWPSLFRRISGRFVNLEEIELSNLYWPDIETYWTSSYLEVAKECILRGGELPSEEFLQDRSDSEGSDDEVQSWNKTKPKVYPGM